MTESYSIDNEDEDGYYTTESNGRVGKEDYVSSIELGNELMRQIFQAQEEGLLVEASLTLKWKKREVDETYIMYDKDNRPEFIVDSTSIKKAEEEMLHNRENEED
jgi:hypothetical protein